MFKQDLPKRISREEIAVMQSMKYSAPKDIIEKDFNSVCLKWATESEIHYFLEGKLRDINDTMPTEDLFEEESCSSVKAAINVLQTNLCTPPFTLLPPQPILFLYIEGL